MNEMIPQHDPRYQQPDPGYQQHPAAQPPQQYQAIRQDPRQFPRPCPTKPASGPSLQDQMQLSEIIAGSTMVPREYSGNPSNVLIAMRMGQEVGLDPFQAVQSIAVINGRPSMWGDALLAVCRAYPQCEYIREHWDANTNTAICIAKRKDDPAEVQRTFSFDDAKRAKLWGKRGPWTDYPQRMCQMRARSWTLRDAFADALKGIRCAEEDQDIPEIVVQPAPDVDSLNAALGGPQEQVHNPNSVPTNKIENMIMDVTTAIHDTTTLEELQQIGADLKGSLGNVPDQAREILKNAYRSKLNQFRAGG